MVHASPTPLEGLAKGDLLHALLDSCDRDTLATYMRVSRDLHEIASPRLYRHLYFDASTNPFFAVDDALKDVDKRQDLRRVRTLTIAPHRRCLNIRVCRPPGSDALEVLRIVLPPHVSSDLCVPDNPCRIMGNLRPETLIIDGLSSPHAAIPNGLGIDSPYHLRARLWPPPYMARLDTVIFCFKISRYMQRMPLNKCAFRIYPGTVKEVLFYYPRGPRYRAITRGAGRLLPEGKSARDYFFQPAENNDSKEVNLRILAGLLACAIANGPNTLFTILDAHLWDPTFCGLDGGASHADVIQVVNDAISSAVAAEMPEETILRARVGTSPPDIHLESLSDFLRKERPDLKRFFDA